MGRKHGIARICLVCGDVACGINFNAASCMSCKTFFRRNALRLKEIKCQFGDGCSLNRVTRKFCTKCRLQKCFEVGMKKEMIKSDNERHELQEKIRLNRIKRCEQAQNKKQSKPLNEQLNSNPQTSDNFLGSVSKSQTTTSCLSSSSMTMTLVSDSSSPRTPFLTNITTQSELKSNKDCLEMFETDQAFGSSLDDICNFNDMSSIDLSDIEVMPFESENSALSEQNHYVPADYLTNLVPNQKKTNSIINFEPEFAHFVPKCTTFDRFGFPVDELVLAEQNLLLELLSASSVLRNPYKRIENFRYEAPYCHETIEFTFYRLIRMCKKLTAFGQLTSESQDQVLKHSLIPMLYIRTVLMYNQHRNAWAFVNDRSKSSVMFRLDTIKPYCIKVGYERQENFPRLFRDEWKQDKAIFDLLTAIVLFSPNVNYHEYDKINSEQHRYIRLLHRYLQAKYPTKSEADECFHQLMYNLKECDLLTEDIITFFRLFRGSATYFYSINDISNDMET